MAPQLSTNTMNLRFMQRGAATKAAASHVRQQEEVDKQKVLTPSASNLENGHELRKPVKSSSSSAGSSSESDEVTDGRDDATPTASTSGTSLSRRPKSTIVTEASYLSFPILSNAYGVTSTTSLSEGNGRRTYGQTKAETINDSGPKTDPQHKASSRSANSSSSNVKGKSAISSIRESARESSKAQLSPGKKIKKEDSPAEQAMSDGAKEDYVTGMIEEARQKRRTGDAQPSRKRVKQEEP